eukprot:7663099-Pyramimonas_sp.AAC.1
MTQTPGEAIIPSPDDKASPFVRTINFDYQVQCLLGSPGMSGHDGHAQSLFRMVKRLSPDIQGLLRVVGLAILPG